MQGVDHATIGILILLVIMIAPVLFYIAEARARRKFYIRRIAGIDAIDEAIGRTAELGRPASFSTGLTGVNSILYACLGVLYYICRKSSRYRTKVLIPQNDPEVMAIVEDVARDAYRAEGKAALFDPRNVLYLSNEQFAFAAGYMGMIQREQAGAAFLFGSFAAESLLLAEAGQQAGAMQVGASVSPEQVAFFICTCDYTLVGEELFAASAYLTREPVQLGSLIAQDRAKLVFFVLIVIGVVIATGNSLGFWPTIPNVDFLFYWELWQ